MKQLHDRLHQRLRRFTSERRHHSHDRGGRHAHHHGALATPSRPAFGQGGSEGIRAVLVSLIVLGATSALQLVVVLISGSVALLADSIHNLADAATAIPLTFAFWIGRRTPNKRYTYGYGRAEDLAGGFVVAVIALSAAVAGWEAIERLVNPSEVRNVGWVALAGAIGFGGNQLAAAYRIRVGRRMGSAALVADGHHARADALSSLAVVGGAVAVMAGVPSADPIAGLVITAFILITLKHAATEIKARLMDSVDPALVEEVERVLRAIPGIEGVGEVRLRWVGHELRAEAQVVSDCDLTLAQAHEIAEEGRHRLLHEIPHVTEAIIHSDPCSHDGRDHHFATAHHFAPRGR